MPRPQNLIPSFRKHIASGQAFVEIDGRPIYLGLHGTDYARENYDRFVREYLDNGRRVRQWAMSRGSREATCPIRVVNLVARYWEYARGTSSMRTGTRPPPSPTSNRRSASAVPATTICPSPQSTDLGYVSHMHRDKVPDSIREHHPKSAEKKSGRNQVWTHQR
ncbi:MAG: hypothetical protein AAGH92_05340 [Planctomycetota bacterium]